MYSKIAISACLWVFPFVSPDQLRLDGFEKGFNGGIIIAIALTAHGYLEAMLAQYLLIVV